MEKYFIALLGLIILIFTVKVLFVIKQKKVSKKSKKIVLRIRVSKNNEKTAKTSEQIFSSVHSGLESEGFFAWLTGLNSPHFSFEIASIENHIYFYIWCEEKFKDGILGQIYGQYPDIEIDIVDDYAKKTNIENKQFSICSELDLENPYIYPIKRYPQFEDKVTMQFLDPLSGILAPFSSMRKGENLAIQMIISPIGNTWRERGTWAGKKIQGGFNIDSEKHKKWYTNMLLEKGVRGIVNLFIIRPILFLIGLGPKSSLSEEKQIKDEVETSHHKETINHALTGKLSQMLFKVNIRIMYSSEKKDIIIRGNNKIKELIGGFYQFNIPRLNSFKTRFIKKNLKSNLRRYSERKIIKPFVLCTEELATIWHLPNETVLSPNIQWVKAKTLEPPLSLPTGSNTNLDDLTILGETNFRGERKKFGIKPEDRRRHIYIIGKTGMGKSTILENMIISDIQNGKGVAVIDPHGDLAEAVLNFIPKKRTNDVIILDPSDKDFPVSFNMLECKNQEHRNLIASGLLGVFKKMFAESWGPRLQHILRNTLLALAERPNSTLLGIMKMLTDKSYRDSVVKKLEDPMVKSFWIEEFGKWDLKTIAENVSPIQNKVGQFLSSSIIRNILGQPLSSMNLRHAMDKKKIIIVNLSKGRIGEDNSNLLGSMLITKFQLDAMSRADISEKERTDFYLYVDEFQNFATDSFATILSEARKYKLNLTMANQYVSQMHEDVKDAIFGNVGSLAAFQVGADDADIFSKQFSEIVMPGDLVNTPKYQCYMKLMIDGLSSDVFSVNTLAPPEPTDESALRENLFKVSREKYAKKRAFVELKIKKWMENPK